MVLTNEQKVHVQQVIKTCLRKKFQNYKPESNSMPFHFRLLGRDRMALYSFVQSLNTTFGTSIFEPAAQSVALINFPQAELQQTAGTEISSESHRVIQEIIDNLVNATTLPDKEAEIQAIRQVCQEGEMKTVTPTKIDIKLTSHDGTIWLIDCKTAKPNIDDFKGFKRTLLEWVAATLVINPNARIQTLIAIPYNPYAPQPYNRWTIRGMLDPENELKVAEEFWDFLGGEGTYQELLDCFEQAGIELRPEIDEYFSRFNQRQTER